MTSFRLLKYNQLSMASDEVSAPSQLKYDVFVNFRGTDTRDNFFSHLKDALVRNGINVFTDEGLNVGAEISTTLDSKIRESVVSVVVFSPNYADSRWCLDELVRIMECKKANGQTVLPVFVQGVEPTHVRKQIGAFGEGFGRLIRDDQYADRKSSWESALKQAADLSGLVTHKISEGVTVKKLLKSIQSVLSPVSSIDLDKYFIGIEHVEEVESLVLSPNIRCLGIWGMGGSGKTTLAKKIYERLSNNFDASCFVEKVRESAGRGELKSLQRDMLSQLLRNHATSQGPPTIYSPDIRRKLKITRVIVILDDVSDPGQLKELIGDRSLYCPGSKMIAISRDRQVLKNIDCDGVYEVKALDDHESLRLIKHHILKGREPTPDQMQLLKDAIKYARGLPLALEVLGRYLFDKDITIWRSKMVKLGDIPDPDVTEILRTSFDELDNDEKNIFLDIACFMEGWDKDRAERMLDACKFHAIIGIDRLVDKALVTVSYGRIQMHDLLQQMGQDIASGSRLYKMKEIANALTRKQERERKREIQVISMDLFGEDRRGRGMELSPRVFKGMTKLRILRFWHVPFTIPGGLKYLSDQLGYLDWHLYPEQSLPPRFNPENLVELRMKCSNLRQLWTAETEPCLPSLKHVDLSFSKKLTTLPNFRNSSKLETLELGFCENLKEVPDLSHLKKLVPLFSSKTAGDWYSSGACIPGEQVPKWFKYSNKGPSIQVNTDPLHHSGFYFYVVCDSPTNSNGCFGGVEVTCEGSTESGGTFYSSYLPDTPFREKKHTIIWCHHLGLQELSHNNQFDLNGATFHFSAEMDYYGEDCDSDGDGDDSDEDDSEEELIVLRIVKCGVMPFYTNDDNHHGDDSDDKEDNDDGNNDKNEDYNNKGRQWLSSCTLLVEEELGDAYGLDLNFPAPDEEGRGACGFDLNFSAPIEDDLDLDLRLAPPAAERASLVDRSRKRKYGNDEEEEEEPRGHKRNN